MPRWPAALLLVVLMLAAAACGGGGDEEYSPEVEREFTESCVDSAVESGDGALGETEATAYCSCTYREIETNIPFEQFAEYDEQAREDPDTPPPPEFREAAEKCRADQGYSAAVKQSFTSQCVESALAGEGSITEAQAREYCDCTFAEIEANVPFDEFAEYDAKARKDPSAEPPPKIAAAVETCAESVG